MITQTAKSFRTFVRGEDPVPILPGFLRPIDTDKLARDLKLISSGADRGASELPRTDETTHDSLEQRIIQRMQAVWAWQGEELIKNLRTHADRLVGYSVHAEMTKLRLIAGDTKARLFSASHQADAELGPLREAYLAARSELRKFQDRHHLERPARDPAGRWTTFGLLFVLIAVESVLNGFFFAKGSEFGLIGGIGTAIGISSVNVLFAFLLGLWPARFIWHRVLFLRVLGILLTLIGLATLISLHVFAAHFREATALVGEERALQTALETLFRAPWRVSDPSSAYLFGLGILFSISAFWKGYTFDDPYPGYGATFRRVEGLREAYSDEHSQLFGDLEDVKSEAVTRLEHGMTTIPIYPQQAAQIRAQRLALVGRFRAYEGEIETATNQLLQVYRDENRRRRSTPPPPHFNERWHLKSSFIESGDVVLLTAEQASTSPEDMANIRQELGRLADEVLTEYTTLLTRYPHPTQME